MKIFTRLAVVVAFSISLISISQGSASAERIWESRVTSVRTHPVKMDLFGLVYASGRVWYRSFITDDGNAFSEVRWVRSNYWGYNSLFDCGPRNIFNGVRSSFLFYDVIREKGHMLILLPCRNDGSHSATVKNMFGSIGRVRYLLSNIPYFRVEFRAVFAGALPDDVADRKVDMPFYPVSRRRFEAAAQRPEVKRIIERYAS
jgi:hypothetical protein